MPESFDDLIDEFYETHDDNDPETALADIRELLAGRASDDPEALFEWAGVHDWLGLEAEAIPLYRQALVGGLAEPQRSYAVIQLASSLRNIGQADEAVSLLQEHHPDVSVADAAQAFLALALHSTGQSDEALRVALRTVAKNLTQYGRAVTRYADEL